MKTKKTSKTNARSRIIFFAILFTYNLLLGLYLKDFLVISPMLVTLYLLSVLPSLFFVLKIRSTPMRAFVLVVLFLVMATNIVCSVSCRRLLPLLTFIVTAIEMMYFGIVDSSHGKDKPLTKISVLAVATITVILLFSSYNFVYKPEVPYLSNGRDTLWDTQTEELADEICAGCETDAEKAQAFHNWIVVNFEYDYDCNPIIQYFDVRKTLCSKKGLCFDFAHLFAAFCRSQNIPCYVIDGTPYDRSKENHTWNRVYFNGSWWDIDLTNDILAIKDNRKIYGFHKLESIASPDKDYYITRIY